MRKGILGGVFACAAAVLGLRLLPAEASNIRAPLMAAYDTVGPVIASQTPSRVLMRNVDFHIGDGVLLHIASLDGAMQSVKHGVVDFDDKMSYVLTIDTGTVGLGASDLTNLLNRYVFAYPGAPLKRLKVSMRGEQLGMTGILRKGVDIPFDITSTITLGADQTLRLHPTKIRIFGVNGAKLLTALGLSLQKMLNLSRAHGVVVKGNDLIMTPLALLPPPAIRGHISAVRIVGDRLEQLFAASPDARSTATSPPPLPDSTVRNYMLYRGGTLHFGKLYMTDAELLVVDEDIATPFDFDNDHYQRQLVAGHSRTLPDLGLEVYMPDAARLGAASVTAASR
jgi:hypothetical protein